MIDKGFERCYILRADCRDNKMFVCEYLYICDIQESCKIKEIRYSTTPNIMYADKLHHKDTCKKYCEYINKDMEQYEDNIKFDIVPVMFTTTVEERKDEN